MDEYADGKGLTRWAWVEIDSSAIAYNIRQARDMVGRSGQLMAVVKADAYGHGAEQVSRIALKAGADRLAVATVAEGVKLRSVGISAPILCLAEPPITSIPLLVDNDITPTVDTVDFAIALGEAADARGQVALYHLAINTGMNRIGVMPANAVPFLQSIDFHRGIRLEGVFTHFATADCPEEWDFRIQLRRFNDAVDTIRAAGFNPDIVHAASSPATIRYPEARFDMVRYGISMYGLHSSDVTRGLIDLRPAMSVKARVSFVQTPATGEGVSYGMHYRTPGGIQIATLPLGYGDGMARVLSGRCQVLINGMRYNQVGNICMDQMMVEIPGSSPFRPHAPIEIGDEAVIIGRQGDEEITLDDHAALLDTITHEVAIHFGQRLQRFYV
jgi:alanine racemase